ncbi:MAG TPA: PadR family transcriptional regulator [Caulifigura sp.]|nr:PadR family transcriptional regulator [Caulifigura sp.]
MKADELLRHFYGGFIRLHILYHAAKEAIYGAEMMEELRRHGYRLGPGTLYPILHDLEQNGLLKMETSVVRGKQRKNYRITKKGENLMAAAKGRLRELFHEVIEDRDAMSQARKSSRPS